MGRIWLGAWICVVGTVVAVPAHAQVMISLEPTGGQQLADLLGESISSIEQQLTDLIDEELLGQLGQSPEQFLGSLAAAQAASNSGLGVDYASNPSSFIVGFGVGGAVEISDGISFDTSNGQLPVNGVGANFSLMFGKNLGFAGFDDITVFANLFGYRFSLDQLTAEAQSLGVHVQYKLLKPPSSPGDIFFQWGGIDFTGGVAFSRLGLKLEEGLRTNLPLGQGIDAVLDSAGTFEVSTKATSIPLEVSTNIRVLYALSFFTGLGAAIQVGGSTVEVRLEGDLTAEEPFTGSTIDLGRGTVTFDAEGSAPTIAPRVFGGFQLNMWALKLFVQVNYFPGKALGGATGLRVAI